LESGKDRHSQAGFLPEVGKLNAKEFLSSSPAFLRAEVKKSFPSGQRRSRNKNFAKLYPKTKIAASRSRRTTYFLGVFTGRCPHPHTGGDGSSNYFRLSIFWALKREVGFPYIFSKWLSELWAIGTGAHTSLLATPLPLFGLPASFRSSPPPSKPKKMFKGHVQGQKTSLKSFGTKKLFGGIKKANSPQRGYQPSKSPSSSSCFFGVRVKKSE
jgi:hypothetical protein